MNSSVTIPRDPIHVSPRVVFSNFGVVSDQLKPIIKKLSSSYLNPCFIFHPQELLEGGFTDIEKSALRDLAKDLRGPKSKTLICEHPHILMNEQVIFAAKNI